MLKAANTTDIRGLYRQIIKLKSLEPSLNVNSLFSNLVNLVLKNKKIDGLSESEIENLQFISSQAETALEKYWANKVINSRSPWTTLKKFPYYENYIKLTKLELAAIQSCETHTSHSILFVGGGPLPMSAIVMAKFFDQSVSIIDSNKLAVQKSKLLIDKLQLDNKIQVKHVDALNFEKYSLYNIIMLAALAGNTDKEKLDILSRIKTMSPKNTHILARSSWGSRRLLYRPIPKQVGKIFKTVMSIKPMNNIVNSFVIFKS